MDSVIVYNDISDHFPIALNLFNVLNKPASVTPTYKRFYSSESVSKFIALIMNDSSFEEIADFSTTCVDPNICYNRFIDTYSKLFNDCFPLQITKGKNKPRKDWMSAGLVRCCLTKSSLQKV